MVQRLSYIWSIPVASDIRAWKRMLVEGIMVVSPTSLRTNMHLDELPSGRDWSKDVMSGIHANPSMNHLHIHVLSRDMVSEPMKKTNHYLSFTTDFFVPLDQFPLPENDHRRHYTHFPADMHCWRCGKNFGNKISKLKEHLADEFEEWKKE